MTRSKRPSEAPRRPDSRKALAERAGILAARLRELEQELEGRVSPKREAEIYRAVARVWQALKGEMGELRAQRALVVQAVEKEGDSLRAVEHKARMTGRPSDHDPVEFVRDRISVLPGAERAMDGTILKAVSAWANNRQASIKWTALADLCVEIGLAATDEEALRADYEEWKREKAPKKGKRSPA
jgi:hypothetical protein